MTGNCFILIKDSHKDLLVPDKLKDKYSFTDNVIDDDTGEVIDTIPAHTSWYETAKRLESKFGSIRDISINGIAYILIELELSFVHGEVQSVIDLQSDGDDLNYNILTLTEANALLNQNN